MTTKQEEYKALEKIKKIVDSLGENSYIGTAFAGCFEVARQNIDFDWGCSLKERAESAEEELEECKAELKDTINQMQEKYSELASEYSDLEESYKMLKKHYRQLQDCFNEEEEKRMELEGQLKSCASVLDTRISELEMCVSVAADEIVQYAGTPSDVAFVEAVQKHRKWKQELDRIKGIREFCAA